MLRLFLVVGVLGALMAPVTAAEKAAPGQIVEPAGGFAFTPPKGWNVRDFPGSKYKIAHALPKNGFAANLTVYDEQFKGSLADYTSKTEQAMRKGFDKFKLLGSTPFKTTSGIQGMRVATQSFQENRMVRQLFYLLPGKGDRRYVVTFSALLEDGTTYDAQIDAALKTFTLR